MAYESAWLNEKIGAGVKEITQVDNIYVWSADTTETKNNRILKTATAELKRQVTELYGCSPSVIYTADMSDIVYTKNDANANIAIILENKDDYACEAECEACDLNENSKICVDGAYSINACPGLITIKAGTARGALYGVFRTCIGLKIYDSLEELNITEVPASPFRMLNHWDNMDGSIERGYSGRSFFFKDNQVIVDDRTVAYARLIASIGINAVVINNVNVRAAATKLIAKDYRKELKQLLEIFADYGVDLYLSLNFAAPIELGGLDSSDPCNAEVISWWKVTLDELFTDAPLLKGFLIKADSEGRPGPFTYGRTHAEGANMLADIIAPYGGTIIWRCFVYNCKQDWRDTVTDRAKAQYDNFMPLDGQFRENVILQIKNGPMDFQVREPVAPLFGGLKSTNEIIEFQIAQEYTGQQKHVCYLIPEFKNILKFKTYIQPENDTVGDVVTGKTFGNKRCGMCAVTNTGDDENWTGHDLAAANLYGFGRLAFNPELDPEAIAGEWIRLTFGRDNNLFHKMIRILITSHSTYEKYTAPLGVGWMVNPSHHYGPNVDGYEFSEWGTYHRSDKEGMGVNRGSNGTDYVHQYNEPNASLYNSVENCPDELILFMHHVPYTHRLHSGKTVIQHIYDTHFEGAQEAQEMLDTFRSLEGTMDDKVFKRILDRFEIQAASAIEWRDHINGYYREKSGIADEKGRI